MLELLAFAYRDTKHRFNLYRCSFCNREVVRRQRGHQHASCGCQMRHTKHGHDRKIGRTPELRCYRKMRERCYNQKSKDFKNYGGRGIRVCPRWLLAFENFLADMGLRPNAEYSIERRDVDGDYMPSNCCWATRKVQARNTRTNRRITINGETRVLVEWLEIVNISKDLFYRNINRGMSESEALGIFDMEAAS